MPSPVEIYFKPSFKAEYRRLPATIRSLFDACNEKLETGTTVLHQQGWMHYALINEVYVAWGMYVPEGFLWASIGPIDRLPMIL